MAEGFYFNGCSECGRIIPFGKLCQDCQKKIIAACSGSEQSGEQRNIYHCGHVECAGHEKRFEECFTKRAE